LRLRRLSLKCWFMGHDDWIRRTPDRLYLECFECGRETHGWPTKNNPVDRAGGAFAGAQVLKHKRRFCARDGSVANAPVVEI